LQEARKKTRHLDYSVFVKKCKTKFVKVEKFKGERVKKLVDSYLQA
jgi:hypothetical protein